MVFKASLDKIAKIITVLATILFAAILVMQLSRYQQDNHPAYLVFSLFLITVYLVVYLYRPLQYSITTTDIVIHRPVSKVTISKSDIKSVVLMDREQLKWSIRTFGVGGLFGYYGKFTNSQIGNMTWYATRRDNMILITTTDNKRIVVSPDEPALFLQHLNG